MKRTQSFCLVMIVAGVALMTLDVEGAEPLPSFLNDRGTGIATSMFGTYVRPGELLIYPFFEYYHDNNLEYKPSELGYPSDEDFEGKYRAYEGLIFSSYGFNDWLAMEIEAAVIDARLTRDPNDVSGTPDEIHESGVGDVEGELRARWLHETQSRPEAFSFLEVTAPVQKKKLLIATPDWEFKLGTGLTKGYRWGTMTVRGAVAYSKDESKLEVGEYAVEYLKRLSSFWRIYAGIEGEQDEVELITEAQLHFSSSVFLKLNNSFGLTPKATDWAPEIGVMFTLPVNRHE
jgi:hypothetical protein